jgi:hypothetical protein
MSRTIAQLDAFIDLLVDVLVREIEREAQQHAPGAFPLAADPEPSLRPPLEQRCSHAPRNTE